MLILIKFKLKHSSRSFIAKSRPFCTILTVRFDQKLKCYPPDRVGRNVKLSIRESLENGSDVVSAKEAVLPGQHTIFNLDKQKSKLYVGGAPSDALPKLQGKFVCCKI